MTNQRPLNNFKYAVISNRFVFTIKIGNSRSFYFINGLWLVLVCFRFVTFCGKSIHQNWQLCIYGINMSKKFVSSKLYWKSFRCINIFLISDTIPQICRRFNFVHAEVFQQCGGACLINSNVIFCGSPMSEAFHRSRWFADPCFCSWALVGR